METMIKVQNEFAP